MLVPVMDMKKLLPVIPVLGIAVLLLLRPQESAAAVSDGLTLCARTVIPSLFPFFAVISLLLQLGLADALQNIFAKIMEPVFHMRGICAVPLLAGLLGGYPSGPKAVSELYTQGAISRQEAEVLLGFCDNCGPAFLLSYVGAGILGSTRSGAILWLIHIAAAFITGILLCRVKKPYSPALPAVRRAAVPTAFPQALTSSVTGALQSTLNICAFVILFRVLAVLPPVPLPFPVLGALEMVSGIAALPDGRAAFIAAAAVTGWGGLSVHCQAMSLTAPAGLSFRWHWLGKLLQAILCVLFAFLMQAKL